MRPDFLLKCCFGLGLATIGARGLLVWVVENFYDLSDSALEGHPPEVVAPANSLISVAALIGLAVAVVAFKRGARGQLLYAAVVLNSVALFANQVVYAAT
jgi:hypothetical protein